MQRLFIAGRIGKNAELRHTGNGDAILNFTVAVDNGKDKPATWYDAALWGKRGESVKDYMTKGKSITLIGRPTVRVHEGKAYLGISVDDFTFQSKATESERDDYHPQQSQDHGTSRRDDLDDDIPF